MDRSRLTDSCFVQHSPRVNTARREGVGGWRAVEGQSRRFDWTKPVFYYYYYYHDQLIRDTVISSRPVTFPLPVFEVLLFHVFQINSLMLSKQWEEEEERGGEGGKRESESGCWWSQWKVPKVPSTFPQLRSVSSTKCLSCEQNREKTRQVKSDHFFKKSYTYIYKQVFIFILVIVMYLPSWFSFICFYLMTTTSWYASVSLLHYSSSVFM